MHESEGEGAAAGEGSRIWVCEFCGKRNAVDVDAEEIPKGLLGFTVPLFGKLEEFLPDLLI